MRFLGTHRLEIRKKCVEVKMLLCMQNASFVFETLKVKFEAMAQGLLLVIAHTLSKKKNI